MKVVHYINRDKFTSGYINFMKTSMTEYDHYFITLNCGFELDLVDSDQVMLIKDTRELCSSQEILNLLYECDKFIVSGCWISSRWVLLPNKILRKMYMHFWGGDFYWMRERIFSGGRIHPRLLTNKVLKWWLYKNCKALVFLIDGEHEKFMEITGMQKEHFVAPMPGNPKKIIMYSDYLHDKKDNIIRIVVGHSATKECQHIEAFNLLAKYKAENINILCPLSYGDDAYKKYVIKCGFDIFGNKFKPITDYMDKESYIKLLADCDIGINNCNRQQGMGNISMLLGVGAKVFIRSDTSMWNNYIDMGFCVFDVGSIKDMDFEQFMRFDKACRERNIDIQTDRLLTADDRAKSQWRQVMEDKI